MCWMHVGVSEFAIACDCLCLTEPRAELLHDRAFAPLRVPPLRDSPGLSTDGCTCRNDGNRHCGDAFRCSPHNRRIRCNNAAAYARQDTSGNDSLCPTLAGPQSALPFPSRRPHAPPCPGPCPCVRCRLRMQQDPLNRPSANGRGFVCTSYNDPAPWSSATCTTTLEDIKEFDLVRHLAMQPGGRNRRRCQARGRDGPALGDQRVDEQLADALTREVETMCAKMDRIRTPKVVAKHQAGCTDSRLD